MGLAGSAAGAAVQPCALAAGCSACCCHPDSVHDDWPVGEPVVCPYRDDGGPVVVTSPPGDTAAI